MLDKDKLLLVVEVGVKDAPHKKCMQRFANLRSMLTSMFDESVKAIVVTADKPWQYIKIRRITASKLSPAKLQAMLDKADKLVKQLTEGKQ